ncbi:hypothetical protein K402DRAFT_393653 [Aulographum hederae CBS 113979]|uniref:GIY-YIG domain-containing protein n=1 Tax=Aulographum hederae CBS 113979 TaxID=1176131 RepID=A0A6G1H035_9PEZI|nr:hypothetical protein K402DRAFT_393653 [Aulographum hederae CBS 113979]
MSSLSSFMASQLPIGENPPNSLDSILDHLLTGLTSPSSRHYPRYGHFVSQHSSTLASFLTASLTPSISSLFSNSSNPAPSSLISLPAYPQKDQRPYHGRAIYLHILHGADGTTRLYIGQATNLAARLSQHADFRYRRDNPSLHTYAMQRSARDSFVVLAKVTQPPAELSSRPDLLMNLLEMWCCLLFRTLQTATLRRYLPDEVLGESNVGLNVGIPLDYGDPEAEALGRREFALLRESGDEFCRRHYWYVAKRRDERQGRQLGHGNSSESVPGEIDDGSVPHDTDGKALQRTQSSEPGEEAESGSSGWIIWTVALLGGVMVLSHVLGPPGTRRR